MAWETLDRVFRRCSNRFNQPLCGVDFAFDELSFFRRGLAAEQPIDDSSC